MPYASNAELPAGVRTRYSERCQIVFREAFNRASGSEASHFRIAHTAARNCMESTSKAELDLDNQGVSAKAVLSSAQRENLPDSAFACREQRKYPHHHADGSIDLPHLRNALARVAQSQTSDCGVAHLRAHARMEKIGEFAK